MSLASDRVCRALVFELSGGLQIGAVKNRLEHAAKEADVSALQSAIAWATEISNATGELVPVLSLVPLTLTVSNEELGEALVSRHLITVLICSFMNLMIMYTYAYIYKT